ncbi:MAG: hypothetical protein IPP73_14815 [Chitinophagaceae bacterium]|nr:hypothetical protein [Chitinophagaceae bacterium]
MKIVISILSTVITAFFLNSTPGTARPANQSKIDYCRILDSLIKQRYRHQTAAFNYNSEEMLQIVEKGSGIWGTYSMGFGGMIYCDTFFNNDVRRWRAFFHCDSVSLPAARLPSPPCDTTHFIQENQ